MILRRFATPACILVLVVPRTSAGAQQPEPPSRPTLRTAVGDAVRMDGVLDEPAWSSTDSISNLTQSAPGDALVFGIRADDPNPALITSFSRNRDANLTSEDHVRIVLDTYLDGRSGYVFIVNPYGARYDALVANQSEGENAQWDAIWEAATHRDGAGWSAEIRIPVQSLLFKRGLTEWGF